MAPRLVIRRLSVGNAVCRRKLLKAFHNEKKQQFDISKVPDIYDSAKYDAIHNSELGLNLKQLYTVSSGLQSLRTSEASNSRSPILSKVLAQHRQEDSQKQRCCRSPELLLWRSAKTG